MDKYLRKSFWVVILVWSMFGLISKSYGQNPTTDLTLHQPITTPPSGATFEWHSALPISSSNLLTSSQAQAAGVGLYYGVYNYGTCYGEAAPLRVATNVCNFQTVDLRSLVDSTQKPLGTVVSFHSSSPVSSANRLTGKAVEFAGAGTYYVCYYDATSQCYSEESPLVVLQTICPDISLTIPCSSSTLDLNTSLSLAISLPVGVVVTWHTDAIATTANKVLNPSAVGPGKYYSAFFDVTNNCYSPTGIPVVVNPAACNQPPLATNDITSTTQGVPVGGNVLTNDDDPEGGVLTALTTPVTQPSKGIVEIKPDGTFTYTPNPTAVGQDVFCYAIVDVAGLKDTACVTVTIVPRPTVGNDKPLAYDDNTQTTVGVGVVINAKGNDVDPDGNGTLGNPSKLSDPTHGTVSSNPDGTFTYTPASGFVGTDSFTYQICDTGVPSKCDTATVTINVIPTIAGNDPPVAVDDANTTVRNVAVSGTVASNDSDVDNTAAQLTYTRVSNGVHGNAQLNADGTYTYTYTPSTNYVGGDSFTYKVCDPSGACDTATVVISITLPANNPPVVIGNPIVTETDKPATQCMAIADPDAGDTHTYSSCGAPIHGNVAVSVNNVTHQLCLTYTPSSGFAGLDSLCVLVCDQNGACDTLEIPIVVTKRVPPVTTANPPVVIPTDLNTPKGVPVSTCLPIQDPNVGDTHSYTICGNPTNGAVQASVNNTTHELCITYTPSAGYVGSDKFCIQVCDQGGLCTQVVIPVNVTDTKEPTTPQPPVVVMPPVITDPNVPVTVCGAINDPNAGDTHSVSLCNQPVGGTVKASVNNTTHQLCVTYTPNPGFTGLDEICVLVCDQTGLCTQKIIPVLVRTPLQQSPIANPDYVGVVVASQSKVISVLVNDKNPD